MDRAPTGGLAITLLWGDGEHTFRLPVGAWRKIEAKCQAGPEEITARLAPTITALEAKFGVLAAVTRGLVGRWRVDDVREVLTQGLLYGEPELGSVTIARLIETYVDERPLRENCAMAFAIAMTSLEGLPAMPEKKPKGEPKGRRRKKMTSPTDGSRGETFTGEAGAQV